MRYAYRIWLAGLDLRINANPGFAKLTQLKPAQHPERKRSRIQRTITHAIYLSRLYRYKRATASSIARSGHTHFP